ncbi:hypothetical protein ACEWY4_003143 [Coilia grayii]|uniref:GTPase IMAP family member 8 n=1 Tax=Coilia grayii TaxID=363190 RepID=A0ABD1KQH1_9TELE
MHVHSLIVSTGSATSVSNNPELRLILIGERETGKSAAGNAILGRQAFDAVGVRTRVSLRKQGVVRGRLLAVVDTPGWEWFSARGAPTSRGAAQKEMVRSAELCQPGAHGLLLVVPLAYSFGERERQVAEEHMQMFGQRAWQHTLVLFTVFDRRSLRDTSLEEEVEDNDELRALVDKCGGRYHALYSRPRRDEDPVAELLEKIQVMVEKNEGALLPSQEILQGASRREEEEAQREEEERREREKELRSMRESLKQLEEEEDADNDDDDDEGFTTYRTPSATQPDQWRSVGKCDVYRDDDRQENSAIHMSFNMNRLRSSMQQSCKTQ